ncbi:MAG: radical SAM protein [Magnetococcales bacterium]|nr:radical SAM protein [Magnetococcales bacterium]
MNILLVCPNFPPGSGATFFPLGLAYIAAYLKQAGHRVVGLNFNLLPVEQRLPALQKLLQEESFQVVGAGGMSMVMESTEGIVATVRQWAPQARVVLGGGLITADPETMMHHLRPDFGVMEEGEETLLQLVTFLEEGREDFQNIGGMLWWQGERLCNNGARTPIANLDALPWPDLEAFGMEEHLSRMPVDTHDHHLTTYGMGKVIMIQSSRSCPYRCTFCFHPTSRVYRQRSIEQVVAEIQYWQSRYQVNTFSLIDELFDEDFERVRRFCALLREEKLNIRWNCSLRVTRVDGELLSWMAEAGCTMISYGFESGSQRVLKSMKKGIRPADIARAVALTREARIGIQANFLFGDPADTLETVQESLDFQAENQLWFVDFSAIIPYPGSPLYHLARRQGRIVDPIEFTRNLSPLDRYLWNQKTPPINFTALSDEDYLLTYQRLREGADANHRKRLAHVVWERVVGLCQSVVGVRCEFCGEEGEYPILYPPGSSPNGVPNKNRPFVGVLGTNLLCHTCRRKMHLPVWHIPHMASLWEGFQEKIKGLVDEKIPVVVLPAMDRHWGTVSSRVDFSGLQVTLVMDPRPTWWGKTFLGQTVQPFDPMQVAAGLGEGRVVILPAYDGQSLHQGLVQAGVAEERVVDWRDGVASGI